MELLLDSAAGDGAAVLGSPLREVHKLIFYDTITALSGHSDIDIPLVVKLKHVGLELLKTDLSCSDARTSQCETKESILMQD